ncbi:DUF4296 domain-containing protein [Psychroserpens luteolus]|uniref:DUF4296 domain-containing protein n=1 Tax=Psychroserpens luteolus TaxID=2855840 RepID=UPI001E41B72B|nr:DUF4296 domain-containing protein [Psychroserpens luteolus]MCD2258238.1 DUF4296 domain-containing protein [Psychroserpens luteolus]
MKYSIIVVFIVVLIFSCSNRPSKPKNLISEEKMVDIIYDVSILTAAKGVNKKLLENNGILPENFIYSKHNIDSLQFISSLNYYASDIETYDNIYIRVEERINTQKEQIDIEGESRDIKRKEIPKNRLRHLLTNDDISNLTDGYRVSNVRLSFESTDTDFRESDVLKVSRTTTISSAYAEMGSIDIVPNSLVEVTVFVKKPKNKSALGLRISGVYPNRVDAVFDLNNNTLKGVKSTGYFENEDASIKLINKDWYQCKIKAKANIDKVRIIFGPTDIDKSIGAWEGKSDMFSTVYLTLPKVQVN